MVELTPARLCWIFLAGSFLASMVAGSIVTLVSAIALETAGVTYTNGVLALFFVASSLFFFAVSVRAFCEGLDRYSDKIRG